jgi:hypothetical protein
VRIDGVLPEDAPDREVTVWIDGLEVQGVAIDTDPLAYGIGASLGQGGVLTAVLPRDALDYLRIEFAKRP